MLRKTIQKQIIDALSAGSFTIDDFTVSFDGYELVNIQFKHEDNFYFQVSENICYQTESVTSTKAVSPFGLIANAALTRHSPDKETREIEKIESKYDFYVSPGAEQSSETWKSLSLSNVSSSVKHWLEYLEEELSSPNIDLNHRSSEKQKVRDNLAVYLENYIDDRESRFSSKEASDISQKMEELVAALSETNTLLQGEISSLREAIEEINRNLSRYKKGTWYETTLNRLSEWSSGVERVEKLLSTIEKIGQIFY